MNRLRALVLTFVSGLALLSVSSSPAAQSACTDSDKACLRAQLRKSPVTAKSFWRAALKQPLAVRVGPAPPELVNFINVANRLDGFPNRPTTAPLPADFVKDVADAIAEIPPRVLKLVDKKLVGIYFVNDLGGTGYTDVVQGETRANDAAFVVLDLQVLAQQTANTWATWKENTPFKPDARHRLEARIEADAHNNRKNAIQYILLHELAHVLSVGEKFHPPWTEEPAKIVGYPFAQLSWQFDTVGKSYRSVFEARFTHRKDIVYYLGAKLPAASMASVYAQWHQTNFPTLYAATVPGDDFAESFVSYVHTVIQKRPWQITLHSEGQPPRTYETCWSEPRCATKRALMEKLVGK
jgi:hypothetical protein